ncbi:MAG: hypothetical protein M0Q94_13925 [Candidatus Cloacimonetes bacterium]|nr:hypothetical protein [Candidatus Cloacimonadota bacterium]
MKDLYYYFYDLNEVLIDRYPARIANQIRSIDSNSKFIFIYSEKYRNNHPEKIPDGSKFFFIPDLNKIKLDKIIKKHPPKSLTTIAQRIPDMWILTYFNNHKIPTQLVQHGLWSDRLERIPLIPLLLGKFSKFVNYLKHVKEICRINGIPIYSTLTDLYHFLLKEDITIPESKHLNNNMIRANKVFAFDHSWNDYYVGKYGYSQEMLIYIGNPDLLLLKGKEIDKKEEAVCYLCQSLVEDGRLSKEVFSSFLEILKIHVADQKKLYIKLHPRSKMDFYDILKNKKNIVFTNDLPICNLYIAHYTGLLATAKQISDNILIWLLPNHHTPEYFQNFGSVVTDRADVLKDFISGKIPLLKKDHIKKLSKDELEHFDPIKSIADYLIEQS